MEINTQRKVKSYLKNYIGRMKVGGEDLIIWNKSTELNISILLYLKS